ncbi:hydrolase [Mariniflexile sp.]|uniref:hydrolase n=1 Tax=Mariniflexile sp. TaxID=1979402 RepID=UPI0035699C05
MKQKIFIYLFVFSILLILFQYVNSKRVFEDMNRKLDGYKAQLERSKDSVLVLQNENLELSHFNLERNEDAITYFENKGYNTDELISLIKDELYKLNETKGEHPIIPYGSEEGRHMMINTVKLLNHKWIIADFSDGQFWGELFLTYEITQEQQLKFNLVESFLYPFNQ